jgi:hypothetical protein
MSGEKVMMMRRNLFVEMRRGTIETREQMS